ncbi:hypothetical protein RC55_00030 [Herbaspirillum seropedicae]|uniref:Uncharacterized protein n=2 Tax=Herbaspirillum seropedicae TaxID=964 RepID=D8IZH2_HERSS|nr:hypothetical protein [Herbaspirillum seropedicae]ADJ62292.1 hypothetical protein Hsero_0773 [Herbaspirillum seropedicae SmR1]AKN64443.1 hypothetical protein ACP92_03860 [Herbaspirillum seropedicae]NQE27685.1 hypothetical protein [Herbaspirillum seropedicae]
MQDKARSGPEPEDIGAIMESLFASMKQASLEAAATRDEDVVDAPLVPFEPPSVSQGNALNRDMLDKLAQDPRFAGDVQELRARAEQAFAALLNEAYQLAPVGVSSAIAGNVAMGTTMEVRDLMSASRRNLSGSGSSHDERRLMSQYLVVAGISNLGQPGWDPTVASSYAEEGDNLICALLSPPRA